MKIMVLGSGPDRLGKTGEMDRFAFQALRFLKEQGHEAIWVDENPATVTGTGSVAARVYLEPLTLTQLEKIVDHEKPDGILYGFGGYLAMHLVIFMDREGFLERNNVRVLGTSLPALKQFMDEEIFKKKIGSLGVPLLKGAVAHNADSCVILCRSLGFPIMLKPSFALEGIGGYLAYNVEEVKQWAQLALNLSPVQTVELEQVPVDRVQIVAEYIHDPKTPGKVHLVGTFEALEGVGVHPGNSPIVAPSPTLKDELLEKANHFAGLMAGAMEICGSYQVCFAYSPEKGDLVVTGMHPSLNRFSSLFTILYGLPLAKMNMSLALGSSFDELNPSPISGGNALQEDQKGAVVRVPIFSEEPPRSDIIDTTMCSSGAIVTLGKTLPVAFNRAMDFICTSPLYHRMRKSKGERELNHPMLTSAERLLTLIEAMEQDDDQAITEPYAGFNPALFPMLQEMISFSRKLRSSTGDALPPAVIREAKARGFSDEGISRLTGMALTRVAEEREQAGVRPDLGTIPGDNHPEDERRHFVSYFEEPSREGSEKPVRPRKGGDDTLLILGPGPYRIGLCTEVDQTLTRTASAFRELGQNVLLLNNNPDAASQDLGVMNTVCVEAPSLEILEAVMKQRPVKGVVHQFCLRFLDGLEDLLRKYDVNVFGTPYENVRRMRNVPSLWKRLAEMGIPLLPHALAHDPIQAPKDAKKLGYPVLVRVTDRYINPEADIIYSEAMLKDFIEGHGSRISEETPLLMEVYEDGMTGIEVMAVCDGEEAKIIALLENVEEYGIHAGDCAAVIPPLTVGRLHLAYVEDALRRIVRHFHIVGHLHVELAMKGRNVYVTAVRPYSSLNFPFAEKTIGRPVHSWIARLILGEKIGELGLGDLPEPERVYVRESVFPFSRFPGLDPILSPRMRSFGQVTGIDDTFGKAYYKSQMAINPNIPAKGKVFVSARDEDKEAILQVSKKLLELGFSLVSTQGTARFLRERGIDVDWVHKVSISQPNIIDLIKNGEISLVINIPGGFQSKHDEQLIRRVTVDHKVHLFTTTSGAFLLVLGIDTIRRNPLTIHPC